jgi:hypothetical protein
MFRRYQQMNDASRVASEEAAARGTGIAGAPDIVPAAQASTRSPGLPGLPGSLGLRAPGALPGAAPPG